MGRDIWVTLAEFEETDNSWERHMVDLADYSGKEIEIRFVCRSHHGYMLALSNIWKALRIAPRSEDIYWWIRAQGCGVTLARQPPLPWKS